MCGIWFSIGVQAPRSVISIIAHRGPDGDGWREFESPRGPVCMGHRRLAIIDLDERSAQPMVSSSGRSWITFNGEIYNYKELRDELRMLGYRFRTDSDTEVILNAWEEWREDCLSHFIGMFAFAIYEPESGKAFVARDNFGIKPLYFWQRNGAICFGSEIKQFMEIPGFEARMNGARVYDFLLSGLVGQTNETTFANVFHLRAGHCALIDLFSNNPLQTLEPRRWYHLPEPGSVKMSFEEASDRFRELFIDSVRIHLRADVTVGSCLSGGLDSSAIVATMAKLLGADGHTDKIHTISSCFEEKAVDERQFIAEVVRSSGAKSTYVFPRWQDLPPQLDQITWHQEEPFGSTSIYAQWCVFQRAAQEGLKVMLDGQGADEQLAGYHGVFPVYTAQLLREHRVMDFVRTAIGRTRYHGQPLLPQLRPVLGEDSYAKLKRLLRRGDAITYPYPQFVAEDAFPDAERTKPPYLIAMHRDGLSSLDTVGDLCLALTQTINLPVLLHYEDRNSMAHSVEARVPFLDHRLVDFTIGLGSEHKVVRHLTKAVLRRGMRDILPSMITNRQDKLGFPAPEEVWFKGPLRPWVEEQLAASLESLNGLLKADVVRDYAKQVLDGARPFDTTLWRIIQLGVWQRVFRVAY
jgi:asparagine synthase (glutamine-hydrolysing)